MYGVRGGRPVRRRFVGNYMRMRKTRIYLILILRRGSPFPVVKPKAHRSLMWATGRRITVLNERGNCWSYWGRQNQVGARDGKPIHMWNLKDLVSLALTKTIQSRPYCSGILWVICGFLMRTHCTLRDTTGQTWRGHQRCPVMNRLPRVTMTSRLHKAPQQSPGQVRKMLDMAIARSFFSEFSKPQKQPGRLSICLGLTGLTLPNN
ncbi:hypothetical protein V8E52_000789 [Russula decolorans]